MLIKTSLNLPVAEMTKSSNPPNNELTLIYPKEKQQMPHCTSGNLLQLLLYNDRND